MKNKKRRNNTSSSKQFFFILLIAVVVFVVASIFFSNLDIAWDFSTEKMYTLTDETMAVLDRLESPVSIYSLYSLGNYNKVVLTLLEKYSLNSKNITVSNVDPTGSRAELKNFSALPKDLRDGMIVVVDLRSGRCRVLDSEEIYRDYQGETYMMAENDITSAIRYVATGIRQNVYMMTGHREMPEQEYSDLKVRLQMQNYRVGEYSYLYSGQVLDPESDILVCIAPKEDFSQTEADSIHTFVSGGGTFILMLQNHSADSGDTEDTLPKDMLVLTRLMEEFGVSLNDKIIIGANSAETGLRNTTIELKNDEGKFVVFSECSPLYKRIAENCSTEPLWQTGGQCYVRNQDGGIAGKGPFTTAALSKKGDGIVAVFSTASFVRNIEFRIGDNEQVLDDVLKLAKPGTPEAVVPLRKINSRQLYIDSMSTKTILIIASFVLLPTVILWIGLEQKRIRKNR